MCARRRASAKFFFLLEKCHLDQLQDSALNASVNHLCFTMPSGGLLRDPSILWQGNPDFQRSTIVQGYICAVLIILSALYHYVLREQVGRPKGLKDEDVAQIEKIIVYPIKSCHGISLQKAEISKKGLQYDRRWLIVKKEGLKWLSLREEPKLTFIIPSFEGEEGEEVLRLRLSEHSEKKLPCIDVALNPNEKNTLQWQLLPAMDFYGSKAQGRVVQMNNWNSEWQGSPSEWISTFLEYEVYLIYFDKPASKRQAFPIVKPPSDLKKWDKKRQQELNEHTDIEFQDGYPFLVSTMESLNGINLQLDEMMTNPTTKMRIDKDYWTAQRQEREAGIKMQTFRPNIVLKARPGKAGYPPFSEDSWETIWITNEQGSLPVHLVARCQRCRLTAIDPETAHKDLNVPLGLLRKSRFRISQTEGPGGKGPCFGMYGVPEKSGSEYTSISVGDSVRVRWRPFHLDDEVSLGHRKI